MYYGNVLYVSAMLLSCPKHYDNVRFFYAVQCIMVLYVFSMLSNALWLCMFLPWQYTFLPKLHYWNVRFFYAAQCIMVMFVSSSMLSDALSQCVFFDVVKCILAMYVSSMLSNALRQCVFLRCCQMQFPCFHMGKTEQSLTNNVHCCTIQR